MEITWDAWRASVIRVCSSRGQVGVETAAEAAAATAYRKWSPRVRVCFPMNSLQACGGHVICASGINDDHVIWCRSCHVMPFSMAPETRKQVTLLTLTYLYNIVLALPNFILLEGIWATVIFGHPRKHPWQCPISSPMPSSAASSLWWLEVCLSMFPVSLVGYSRS